MRTKPSLVRVDRCRPKRLHRAWHARHRARRTGPSGVRGNAVLSGFTHQNHEGLDYGKNPISATIPLDIDGVHHGFLRLPYSRDDSAWGSIMIPISVIKNGDGPTALLTGGNHGDEYEGPVALQELAVTLNAEDVSGRLIIVPAFNFPAFQAGTRTSRSTRAT